MELWTRPTLGLGSFLVGKKGKRCSGINNILTWVGCSLLLTIAISAASLLSLRSGLHILPKPW